MASSTPAIPGTADLENPRYYLENMETLLAWVRDHHGDLLTTEERDRLSGFFALATPARALLTRLVMRTGEEFRVDKLRYPELGAPEVEAVEQLVVAGWLDDQPLLSLDQLFRLYTLAEVRTLFAKDLTELGLPRSLAKGVLRDRLQPIYSEARPLSQWPGQTPAPVVRLNQMALFDRVRLMFFGNLRQSWSDFVLVELGHQRYETVPFTPESRAFGERTDVDCYLTMHRCRQWLDEGVPAAEVWPAVPAVPDNPWLISRRDRLLLELGRLAERQGDRELALAALSDSGHREARLKQLRLLERLKRFQDAWAIAAEWQQQDLSDAEAQGLARILKRLSAKLGQTPSFPPQSPLATPASPLNEWRLALPRPASGSVERAVADHLTDADAPVFYVENTLITGLFGLLCWPVLFEPLPGAFFHPFHTGPADLIREDFVSRRQAAFDRCFLALEDGSYRQRIRDTFEAKQGLANPFIVWPVVSRELVELALACIPATDLALVFRRLLTNIRDHRSGFPDLIQFYPQAPAGEPGYRMIEVKGPGDRLQDHQVRWLNFFADQGIAASVCYVRWRAEVVPE